MQQELKRRTAQPVQEESKKRMVHSIQFARFLLATFVVISHVGLFIVKPLSVGKQTSYFLVGEKAVYAELAVTAFITISGFVMYFSVKKAKSAKAFAKDRAIRILPLYFFLTIAAVLLLLFFDMIGFKYLGIGGVQKTTFELLVQSLLFVAPFPILYMAWSLNFEVWFYMLCTFILSMKTKRKILMLFLLTGLISLIQLCYWPTFEPYVSKVIFFQIFFGHKSQFFIYFLLGLVVAYLYEQELYKESPILGLALIVSGLVLGYVVITKETMMKYPMMFTIPSFLIVYGCIHINIQNKFAIGLSKFVGQLSYPIYLSHFFTMIFAVVLI